jgi:dTDP-4-dehydrorhamnose reductase
LSPRAKSGGYSETDTPNPTGIYGQTKLDGEKAIQEIWEKHIIIRTSWVYSQFGNNFMKTMLRLASERDSLSLVNDQIGTPTNAVDLANVILNIITAENLQSKIVNLQSKIFNFSNLGQCSWYDFAKKIFEINNISIDLKPIPTTSFPTPAKRPKYSVLDKSKIIDTFQIDIKSWEESLKAVIFPL